MAKLSTRKKPDRTKHYALLICLIVFSFLSSCLNKKSGSDSKDRISSPGQYSGYSDVIYADDYEMSSQYVEMRDGNKLAIDIYRPKDKITGEVIKKRLPVIWMHTPYNRRYNENRKGALTVDNYAGTASRLIKYGYVAATVDFRGLFASYGHNEG